MDDTLPAATRIAPEWLDFFVMIGVLLVLATCVLVWVVYFRKGGRKHRRHRRHHERRAANPTLAETGGLPPLRPPEPSEKPPADLP